MLNRDRRFEPGCFYHLFNRGNNRQIIFYEHENYLHFLRLIRLHLLENHLDILAYCLMPNHYHLLVQCRDKNISEGMRALSIAYTKGMNRRYGRVGSLFQGRFQAIAVENQDYLYHLVQYIHLNPVKAGLVNAPEEWEFSSYREYAGLRAGTLPNLAVVRSRFESEETYRAFLAEQQVSALPEVRVLMLDE